MAVEKKTLDKSNGYGTQSPHQRKID